MGDKTGISWADASWNPLRGCTRVSEGCRNCYAETVAARFSGPGQPYEGVADRARSGSKWTGKVILVEHMLDQPLRWKKPRRIFVNSMSDLFHESVPDEWIDRIFAVMALCPHHTFQILTKRPERMREYITRRTSELKADFYGSPLSLAIVKESRSAGHMLPENAVFNLGNNDKAWEEEPDIITRTPGWPLNNCWLGVSVENQATADERIQLLLETPASVRFISAEPLLGKIDLTRLLDRKSPNTPYNGLSQKLGVTLCGTKIDWVIAGGESGKDARPMRPDWARSLRDQCAANGTPFFFKQFGEWREPRDGERYDTSNGRSGRPPAFIVDIKGNVHCFLGIAENPVAMIRVGKKAAGALLDGVAHEEFPA